MKRHSLHPLEDAFPKSIGLDTLPQLYVKEPGPKVFGADGHFGPPCEDFIWGREKTLVRHYL